MSRIFFHVDVNSAFLSWSAIKHLRDGEDVDLRTIPAVVGGDEAQRHGVVLAKSGPAKKYGIKTGESLFAARTKYPGIKVVPPDFDFYVQNSKAMIALHRIVPESGPRIQPRASVTRIRSGHRARFSAQAVWLPSGWLIGYHGRVSRSTSPTRAFSTSSGWKGSTGHCLRENSQSWSVACGEAGLVDWP